ncbi:MAG: leucine-rich repeat domain-containing protein, partial [Clostridia bacterium]|nr:leucine-rich repeat domain-containing protein [Clostridia bacterium]
MLTRRIRRDSADKQVAQDGFTASVPAVAPRPWHSESAQDAPLITPASPQAASASQAASAAQAAPAAKAAPAAQAAPARAQAAGYAAYGFVGRRVLELADNGDGTLTVVRCIDKTADDLDIQFEAGACPVSAIAPKAFEGCAALCRVTLPASLRQIGERAFSGCSRLSRVVIPGSVQRVGTLAFANCQALERVRIEPGVQALGPSCFSKCVSLARVDVPSSLTQLGGGVFFGCGRQLCLYGAKDTIIARYAALNGVRFDYESWKEDEELVFEENEDGSLVVTGLRSEGLMRLEIPAERCGRPIVAIAPKAFFACGTLLQVHVGAGVREIGESAFFGCRSLAVLTFERGLERVGESAFAGCEALTQVTLPWGTTAIGRMAFFGCARLGFVKMPATTRVSDLAFEG